MFKDDTFGVISTEYDAVIRLFANIASDDDLQHPDSIPSSVTQLHHFDYSEHITDPFVVINNNGVVTDVGINLENYENHIPIDLLIDFRYLEGLSITFDEKFDETSFTLNNSYFSKDSDVKGTSDPRILSIERLQLVFVPKNDRKKGKFSIDGPFSKLPLETLSLFNFKIQLDDILSLQKLNNLYIDSSMIDINWIRINRFFFTDINVDEDSIKANKITVFLGKNNSGKTFLSKRIFQILKDESEKEQLNVLNLNGASKRVNYKGDPYNGPMRKIQLFFIPNLRQIGKYNGISDGIVEPIKNVMHQLEELERFNPNTWEGQPWQIVNFCECVSFTNWTEDSEILPHIKNIEPMIKIFHRALSNWKRIMKNLFPEFDFKPTFRQPASSKISISYEDTWNQAQFNDWSGIGSGTQQLLSLIFLIEFLKVSPVHNYKNADLFTVEQLYHTIDNETPLFKRVPCNKIIFIDEPELSLHPGLQKKFFEYLKESSHFIQFFIMTHSPYFSIIDDNVTLILLSKDQISFKRIPILNENKMLIDDELHFFSPIEAATRLSRNGFEDVLFPGFNESELSMVDNLKFHFSSIDTSKVDGDYHDILDLGTIFEKPACRLLQEAMFMVTSIEVSNFISNPGRREPSEIITVQINKIDVSENAICYNNLERYNRLCSLIYDPELLSQKRVACYTSSVKNQTQDRINEILNSITDLKENTIIVFPEISLPSSVIDDLIAFSKERKVIIVGGMEHVAEGDGFINQAIIINNDGRVTYQRKHIPYHSQSITEGILPGLCPRFHRFETDAGNIAVLVCKDFLVNHTVIPVWLKKNDIQIVIVPASSKEIRPFLNKMQELISRYDMNQVTVVFSNIAEFGGSVVLTFPKRNEMIEEESMNEGEDTWKRWQIPSEHTMSK